MEQADGVRVEPHGFGRNDPDFFSDFLQKRPSEVGHIGRSIAGRGGDTPARPELPHPAVDACRRVPSPEEDEGTARGVPGRQHGRDTAL